MFVAVVVALAEEVTCAAAEPATAARAKMLKRALEDMLVYEKKVGVGKQKKYGGAQR